MSRNQPKNARAAALIGRYELAEEDVRKVPRLWKFYGNYDVLYDRLKPKERKELETLSSKLWGSYREGMRRIKTPENISILNMYDVLMALDGIYRLEKKEGFFERENVPQRLADSQTRQRDG
jgi:hypothetical protein